MRSLSLVLIASAGLALTACSKDFQPAKRVQVSGTITFEKKPLTTGKITFDPGTGEPPASFDVLDGRYEGRVPVGKNKVMISATRKVSLKEKLKMDGPGYDELTEEDLLPARYNTASNITREVTEAGPNEFNFDLQTK